MMGTDEKYVQLKVFVDKKKNKVMFAEAEEDFVETLFSFFTLPLGTIAKLLRKHAESKYTKFGSLTSLYESVVNLNLKHFSDEECKDVFVNPRTSAIYFVERLKVNLDPTQPKTHRHQGDVVFLKKKANFIITDDLHVAPFMIDTSIEFLNSLGIEHINLLEERTIYFGMEEFLNLLKWSLYTKNPLSNMVLGRSGTCSSSVTNSTLSNSALISSKPSKTQTVKSLVQESNMKVICAQVENFFMELYFCMLSILMLAFTRLTKQSLSPVGKRDSDLIFSKSGQTQTVKLLIQKSNKKLLCAQVENRFVELLFSFLTIPLGTFIRLMKEDSSPLGINNLYNSIACLGDGKYLKSDDIKTRLLCPDRAIDYFIVDHCLETNEMQFRPRSFLKEQRTFIVADDLQVTASPSIATISNFNILGVPVCDIEVLEVSIGEHEEHSLLKALLTSTSALTDCLDPFRKKAKIRRFR